MIRPGRSCPRYVDFVNRNFHGSKCLELDEIRKLKRSFLEDVPLFNGQKEDIEFWEFFLGWDVMILENSFRSRSR